MAVNKRLLRKTLAVIEAHPEHWDQESYASKNECGTTACFAGWAVVLSGYKLLYRHGSPSFGHGRTLSEVVARPEDAMLGGRLMHFRGGLYRGVVSIPAVARRLLGLDCDQAYSLFQGNNLMDDLRAKVAHLCSDDA